MSQLSVASTSAVQKKVQTAIAMAKQRLQTLDGTKEMAEGKLGVERHQAHLSVQSFDKDEIKKNLKEVLDLKDAYKAFVEVEKIAPENIHEQATSKIGQIIVQAGKRWHVPPQPIKFYLSRIADDQCRVACQSKASCVQYVVVIFPYKTSYVAAELVWDTINCIYTCLAPIPQVDKCEVWDSHFLHFFTAAITEQSSDTVCMICGVIESFADEAVEREIEITDEESAMLNSYQEIAKILPRVFKPHQLCGGENFFDALSETLDFFACTQQTNRRYRAVAVAAQDHEEVRKALTDMNVTMANKEQLETAMGHLTSMVASVKETCGQKPVHERITASLFAHAAEALGGMQVIVANLGQIFVPIIEETAKKSALRAAQVVSSGKGEHAPSKDVLNATQQMVGEAAVIWPFEEEFIDVQAQLAGMIKTLNSSRDLEALVAVLLSLHSMVEHKQAYTPEHATDFAVKMTAVSDAASKLDTIQLNKFLSGSIGRSLFQRGSIMCSTLVSQFFNQRPCLTMLK